jgi:hypothetical protein
MAYTILVLWDELQLTKKDESGKKINKTAVCNKNFMDFGIR